MAKALGVGGVIFTSPDPAKLNQWYAEWLCFDLGKGPGVAFLPHTIPDGGLTVRSVMNATTDSSRPRKSCSRSI